MSTTKRAERSSTNVHGVDVENIRAHVHSADHAWINVGNTAFHFNNEDELVAFAVQILFAAKSAVSDHAASDA